MATLAGAPKSTAIGGTEFYSRMALFLLALVFIGFAPSFYLRDNRASIPAQTRRCQGRCCSTAVCSAVDAVCSSYRNQRSPIAASNCT